MDSATRFDMSCPSRTPSCHTRCRRGPSVSGMLTFLDKECEEKKKNIIGTGWKMIVFIEVFMSYKSVLTFYNFCHFDFIQGVLMSHRTVNDSSNVMVWHQK